MTENQQTLLDQAQKAVLERHFFTPYPEAPSRRTYGENANPEGRAAFEAQLGKAYGLRQQHDATLLSAEVSPFTREALGITYPIQQDPAAYLANSYAAFQSWKKTAATERAGILMETLERLQARFFEQAYASMHTTGQGFVMAFQSSGPHANDRALEALAMGMIELERFPQEAFDWVKPMGKTQVRLRKRYHNVPKGIGLVIGCSTFPVWNSIPAVFANLITGNTVILKPHPLAIYPAAIVVDELQQVLEAHGHDPHIVQLAPDRPETPITRHLAEDPSVQLVDYTGGNVFGAYVESLQGKEVFTEKTGVNSILLDSVEELESVLNNLSFSLSLYSGQMCTCPQNIFIPREGIKANGKQLSYEEVVQALVAAVQAFVANEKMLGSLGALQNDSTYARVQDAQGLGARVLLASQDLRHPDFPKARLRSHLILEAQPEQYELFSRELFGPIVFVIPTESREQSLQLAKKLAREAGAISCAAYTTDPAFEARIEEEMAEAGTPVSFNLDGMFWVNQNAAFSDFHVTGGNPAGNASLSDPLFLRRRFTVVGMRSREKNVRMG
jgi:phenylacetic acid degradation protein paaN